MQEPPSGTAEGGIEDPVAARRAGDAAFIAALLAALLVAAIAGPRSFGTNDNVGLIENAAAGHPTPYCAYATTIVLHGLYSRWPMIPWFPIDLVGALLAAAAVLAHLASRGHSRRSSSFASAALVCCLLSPFVIRLDYNSSSILLGASGVLLMACAPRGRLGVGRMALAAALCLWSFSIRRMGFFGAVCLLSPFAILGFARAGPTTWLRAALVAAFVGALVWVDGSAYGSTPSQSYRRYAAFNDVRKSLHNTAYIASGVVDPRALSATGWSANDYWLFANWFYLDEGRFNVGSVGALRAFVQDEKPLPPTLLAGLSLAWRDYRGSYATLALVLVLCALWGRGRGLTWVLFAAGGFVAGSLLMEIYWQLPPHVGLPLMVAAAVALLIVTPSGEAEPSLGLSPWAAALAVAVAFVGLTAFVRYRRENAIHNRDFSHVMEKFERLPPGSVLLLEGGVMRLDWSDPFDPPKPAQTLIRTGMGIFSPLFYENIGALGLRRAGEVVPFIAKSGRGYVVAHAGSIPHLVQFAREAYGIEMTAVPVESLETGAGIYRILPHEAKD